MWHTGVTFVAMRVVRPGPLRSQKQAHPYGYAHTVKVIMGRRIVLMLKPLCVQPVIPLRAEVVRHPNPDRKPLTQKRGLIEAPGEEEGVEVEEDRLGEVEGLLVVKKSTQ